MVTYSDLILLPTFEERLALLRTNDQSSERAFDNLRELNQRFYGSRAWKDVRNYVIARDLGFDLGIPGRTIFGRVVVHHMNPLKPKDLYYGMVDSLDPEFLITVSSTTHEAIHFGTELPEIPMERFPGDTRLW